MLIPYQQLDEMTLNNLIEQYILREGTDYGLVEFSLQEKTQQVLLQIKNEDIHIIYSELEESVTLISKHELQAAQVEKINE
ncbi:YheU family protein [Psychromonas algicola]|uniref:YheU family protein n=1 Tax=Psychromonas algicola TaxID=2555642 RepID=UPI0010688745|nr:YheU family protein [Psychromonas sp. RZ5]TEW48499.1 YheU family protein [Psychromonas sp. RZ5]